MSPLKRSNNIAARMGRWSASHWKTAVFGWLAFVAIAFYFGHQVLGTKEINQNDTNVGQSHKADVLLREAGFKSDPQTEIVLVQNPRLTVNAPAFRAAVDDVLQTVRPYKTITDLRSPYAPGSGQISADRHSAMVEWTMKGSGDFATKHIDSLTKATAAVATRHPAFTIGEAGSISSGKALNDEFESQLLKAGERSIPLTLIVLL